MRPPSNTNIRVALRMVASRCAITNVVRPFMTSSSAACTLASVNASSALVASSRIRIGGFFSRARAIADLRQEALGVALDDLERLRALAGLAHFLFAGVRLADLQVLLDRSIE